MTWQFAIPQFVPTTLNRLMRGRRRDRIRLAKGDRELVTYYARSSGIPPATGKRRVSIKVSMPGRRPDPDSILKSTLDALVAAGLLRTDSSRWCQLGDVTVEHGDERQTVVRLEDLPEPVPSRKNRGGSTTKARRGMEGMSIHCTSVAWQGKIGRERGGGLHQVAQGP